MKHFHMRKLLPIFVRSKIWFCMIQINGMKILCTFLINFLEGIHLGCIFSAQGYFFIFLYFFLFCACKAKSSKPVLCNLHHHLDNNIGYSELLQKLASQRWSNTGFTLDFFNPLKRKEKKIIMIILKNISLPQSQLSFLIKKAKSNHQYQQFQNINLLRSSLKKIICDCV